MQWKATMITSNYSVHKINHKGKVYYWNEFKSGGSKLSDPQLMRVEPLEDKEAVEKYIIENED